MKIPKSATDLCAKMKVLEDLHEEVLKRSMVRLKHEGLEKSDKKLTDPNSNYY